MAIGEARYDTFIASVKLPWTRVWAVLWRAIPDPLTDGRLPVVLGDSINPKTGTKVFACQRSFDRAAKTNQSAFPWAQTIVTLGLLKVIHGRWCCLPLAFAFYLRRATLALRCARICGRALTFETKFTQAVRLIQTFAGAFARAPILVVTDSWFGNNGVSMRLAWSKLPRGVMPPRVGSTMPSPMCAERSLMISPTGVSGSIAAIPAMAPEIPSSLQSWGWWHEERRNFRRRKSSGF